MTRLGKIARLPRELREELNVHLQNGEVGTELVEWLNGLPAVKAVLKAKFDGRAINPQNLSEWKAGGYEDWVRHQENCAFAAMLGEMSGDLEKEAGEIRLEERLVAPLVMALARLLREAEESPDVAERRTTILEVGRQLSQLRRESHQAQRVRMEQERWEEKQSEIAQRESKEAHEAARGEALWEKTKAEFPSLRDWDMPKGELKVPRKPRGCVDGTERVERREEGVIEQSVGKKARPEPDGSTRSQGGKADIRVRRSLTLPGGEERELATAAPGESNQIKPDQGWESVEKKACTEPDGPTGSQDGKADIRVRRSLTLPGGEERELATAALGESNRIKPDQGCQKVPSSEFQVQSLKCQEAAEGGQE